MGRAPAARRRCGREGWVSANMQNDDGKGASDRQYVPLMHDSLRTAIRRECGPTRTTTREVAKKKDSGRLAARYGTGRLLPSNIPWVGICG